MSGAGELTRPGWAPAGIDLTKPNVARVYDYYLGGAHNFAVDRQFAAQAIRDWPQLPRIMRVNRAFLRRAVRFLVDAGIRQFIDLGSGIPTAGNVHEIAQAVDPSCRVVYADVDPIAVAHGRAILAGNDRATAIEADLRDTGKVLSDPELTRVVDLSQPVAVLLIAVLHFVPDTDDPVGVIARYRQAMAPGSYLAICHATQGGQPERAATHQAMYSRTATPMTMRSADQVAAMLDGFDLVEPGLVYMACWRPEDDDPAASHPEDYPGYAAVGRKR
ncbi:MAG TPA: SAM-dependent methyltransferase [Micromonosporaceae bacterium]